MKLVSSSYVLFTLMLLTSFSIQAKKVCFDSTLQDNKAKTKAGEKTL